MSEIAALHCMIRIHIWIHHSKLTGFHWCPSNHHPPRSGAHRAATDSMLEPLPISLQSAAACSSNRTQLSPEQRQQQLFAPRYQAVWVQGTALLTSCTQGRELRTASMLQVCLGKSTKYHVPRVLSNERSNNIK